MCSNRPPVLGEALWVGLMDVQARVLEVDAVGRRALMETNDGRRPAWYGWKDLQAIEVPEPRREGEVVTLADLMAQAGEIVRSGRCVDCGQVHRDE